MYGWQHAALRRRYQMTTTKESVMQVFHPFGNFINSTTPMLRRFLHLCGPLMGTSELWKQWVLTFIVNNGNYDWWYFPFQLCSIPMYLLLLLPVCETFFPKFQTPILTFLATYGLLGGLAVFADTSGLNYPVLPLTVHAYTWHVLMIAIGIASAILQIQGKCQCHAFRGATAIYLCCCLVASAINTVLGITDSVNMFYINPKIPMVQVVFCDLVTQIGNMPTILLYVTATMLGARLIYVFWQTMTRSLVRRQADDIRKKQ